MNNLIRKNGFVYFSRNFDFALNKIQWFLTELPEIKQVVVVYSAKHMNPFSLSALQTVATNQEFYKISFEDYGNSENIEKMKAFDESKLLMIVFDISHMLSNRLDFRLDQIQVRQRARAKIVIEEFPYFVRPWQFYFPYSLLDKTLLGYNHSYAIEGEYKKYKDVLRGNPCAVEIIGQQVAPVTFIDYEKVFPVLPEIIEEKASEKLRADYEFYKLNLFQTETAPASLLRKLDKFVQTQMPCRRVPFNLKEIYQPNFSRVVKTDLPLDNYLAAEMLELMAHSNELTSYLYQHNGQTLS